MTGIELGDRITVLCGARGRASGRVVEIDLPDEGLPGYHTVGGVGSCNSYSGGFCLEHRRPAPPYEGAPHIAPTLPHYTIVAAGEGIMRCACQVLTESKPVELW